MPELKMCPSCGGYVCPWLNGRDRAVFIKCGSCGMSGPSVPYGDNLTDAEILEATEKWNEFVEGERG